VTAVPPPRGSASLDPDPPAGPPLPPPPAWHIDPRSLREVADDPAALEDSIAALSAALAAGGLTPSDELRVRARLGGELRIAGRYDEALGVLRGAVALAESVGDPVRVHAARIRLAQVHQWRGEFAAADALFAELLDAVEGDPTLAAMRPFTLQHAGKCQFDQGRYADAVRLFDAALRLRLEQGAAEEDVASSRQALIEAQRRMAGFRGSPGTR
jgi:tetratricopeptide (TPR) repeat protein